MSDKYGNVPYGAVIVPKGSSFADMLALKGNPEIGDKINKLIIAPLATANKLSDMPDFNDPGKLGDGKEKVERLTNLISIFENPALDFGKNRADGDDILGDAYEYLMQHFAAESGRTSGQFYTPAEVSRVMAAIIGIGNGRTSSDTTIYDPTCGSGSLLLKVADAANGPVTLYGQEKEATTSGLARMNMILHNCPTALIRQGNTLANPLFTTEDGQLKTFDYVVANPPFSDKRWSTGVDSANDPHSRFKDFGVPPAKQGDYAYLLHIVRSLKSTGKGACILPHGVLFRGNTEKDIRKKLIESRFIKGIIGLPANLFYGTGIPACIVVIDKEGADTRTGIFMMDASAGCKKEGPKNRLREMDLHRIVDVFAKQKPLDKYARMVPIEEVERNEFNLNISRYIDSRQAEDIQDIEGHLRGGIPTPDVDALDAYWKVCPTMRQTLFSELRDGYLKLTVEPAAINATIYDHPEFIGFIGSMEALYTTWRTRTAVTLKALTAGCAPKTVVHALGEDLLGHYTDKPLISNYAVYQHLMDYSTNILLDDLYLLAAEGWSASTYRVVESKKGKDGKPGKEVDKGWACDLVPKSLIVARYFPKEQAAISALEVELESLGVQLAELEEEHGGEEGLFAGLKMNKATVTARIKELTRVVHTTSFEPSPVKSKTTRSANGSKITAATNPDAEEITALQAWVKLADLEAEVKKRLKKAEGELDALAYAKYPTLTEADVKALVVDDKWLDALSGAIHGEMDRISQALTQRVKELGDRYAHTLPELDREVESLSTQVESHLKQMDFAWN